MDIINGGESLTFTTTSDVGILLIHGFSGTTSALYSLFDHFAHLGYNIEAPRLSGHGTTSDDLKNFTFYDWINDVEFSYKTLRSRSRNIFVIGLSMGGALALELASRRVELKGVIAINNALIYNFTKDIQFKLIPILKYFIKKVNGVSSDLKDPNEKEIAYSEIPIEGVKQFYDLICYTKKVIKNITIPTLIFKSLDDHVIPVISAKYTYNKIKALQKEIIWLNNSYHVATQDFDKNIIIERSGDFINKILNGE